MSVIHFGPNELANLCAACAARTGKATTEFIRAAARYSQDNDACYCFTYAHHGETPKPWSTGDIQACLPSQADFESARLTARLLRYNLIANSGRDFADQHSLEACALLCEASGDLEQAASIRTEMQGAKACCAEPEILGGCCANCGKWTAEADAGHNLPQGDNQG